MIELFWRTLVALNGPLFEHMCGAMRAVGGITAGRRVCRDGSAVQTAPSNSIKPGHLPRPTTPQSTKAHRIAENFDVFDFELDADELTAIDALDTAKRGGPEPQDVTLEAYGMPIP